MIGLPVASNVRTTNSRQRNYYGSPLRDLLKCWGESMPLRLLRIRWKARQLKLPRSGLWPADIPFQKSQCYDDRVDFCTTQQKKKDLRGLVRPSFGVDLCSGQLNMPSRAVATVRLNGQVEDL